MGTMITYYDVSINKYFNYSNFVCKQTLSQIWVRSKDNETRISKTNDEIV